MSRSDSVRAATAVVAVVAAAVWNARDLSRHVADSLADASAGAALAFAIRIAATVAQPIVVAVAIARARRAGRTPPSSAVRLRALFAYVPATALVAATSARAALGLDAESVPRSVFFAVLLAGSAAAIALPARRRAGDPETPRALRRVELVAWSAIVTVFALELALGVVARVAPSPLLAGGGLEARLAAVRPPPGTSWLGRPLNSGGYHDGEFFAAGDRDLVVAVLADSFGIGVVPYAQNYVTIAESRLHGRLGSGYDRVALHNFGVPAIGLEEYAYLLETEALATRPTRVVVCVFVGNDVTGDHAFGSPIGGRYALQDWLVAVLPSRLMARARSPAYVDALDALALGPAADGDVPEPPSFEPETFLDLEARRLDVANAVDPRIARRYGRFFDGLEWFRRRLGEKLLLLVFPDEFQVDDALWRRALARRDAPDAYTRDLPQRRIAAWARARGVALVDTTGALRVAQRDGPVYALRNTHLNARGNRIAGELLADALAASLFRPAPRGSP